MLLISGGRRVEKIFETLLINYTLGDNIVNVIF
jgi:hypothetical protein